MDKTFLILSVELRQAFRGTRGESEKSSQGKRIARNALGYLALFSFAIFVGTSVYNIAAALSDTLAAYPDMVRAVWLNLMSGLSLGVFVMLFMTGVSVVYQALYDSGDLKFLLSTPTPVGSVVGAKLTVALVRNLAALVPFMYPIWVGYGAGSRAPFSFYFMSILAILLAALLFTAVTAIFAMIVMRNVPTQKMRQVIMIGSLVVGFMFVLATQVLSAKMTRSNGLDATALAQAAQGWGLGRTWYLPHVWVVKTAFLTTPGFGFSLWESLFPLAVAAIGAFVGAIGLSANAFVTGWSAAGDVETGKSGAMRRRRTRKGTGEKAICCELADDAESEIPDTMIRRHTGQGWGIFAKDLTIIKRQPIIWYSILVAIVASGFYLYNMSYGARSGDVGAIPDIMKDVILFVLVMMSTISSGQIAGMCISMDGESLWLLRSMPIDPGTYFNAKMALAVLPGATVFTVLALAMAFIPDIPQYPLYLSLPVGYAAISMLGALEVMSDAMRPNFSLRMSGASGTQNQKDPSKSLISLGISMAGTFVLGAAFAFNNYYSHLGFSEGMSRQAAILVGTIAFATIVVAGHAIARSLALASIKRILRGESN